jgi:hypothetical protein
MIARPLPVRTGEEAVRVVRALGTHRYVHGHLHAIHALAFHALAGDDTGERAPAALAAACGWAAATLSDPTIELDSKDPRLLREASLDELLAVLAGFWIPGSAADRAQERLLDAVHGLGMDVPLHAPFDETVEDDLHPVLVDAGWELRPLADLDPLRHRGVIEAYGEPIAYEAARFEEQSAIPARVTLQELPALGVAELVRGVDADGELIEPLVLWTEGEDVYHDYLLRGVLRAAKIAGEA